MASSTDRSQGADALPRPELNPLLNSLLADNMGRWAEVYFTSPPDKREEAVLELLRELEAQGSHREGHSASEPAKRSVRPEAPASAVESTTTDRNPGDLLHCESCGHNNLTRHQFCGMCGAQLGTASEHLRMDAAYDPQGARNEHAEGPAYAGSYPELREPNVEERLPPAEDAHRDPYDLSPFQSLMERENAAELDYDQPPAGRYRSYIGAVLAILILALVYFAWSSSRSNQTTQGAPPPPPPAAMDTAPAVASPNSGASASSNASKPAKSQPTPAANRTRPAPKPADSPKQTEPAASAMHTASATATPGLQPAADSLEHQNLKGNGADEFAMAQRYLNGTSGQARNSAEAANWLWKSIAKHYGPAMLVLAELYLKGDGVSKNCDQARVLLDSAALRGMAGAGEKLRDLKAFGCQ